MLSIMNKYEKMVHNIAENYFEKNGFVIITSGAQLENREEFEKLTVQNYPALEPSSATLRGLHDINTQLEQLWSLE